MSAKKDIVQCLQAASFQGLPGVGPYVFSYLQRNFSLDKLSSQLIQHDDLPALNTMYHAEHTESTVSFTTKPDDDDDVYVLSDQSDDTHISSSNNFVKSNALSQALSIVHDQKLDSVERIQFEQSQDERQLDILSRVNDQPVTTAIEETRQCQSTVSQLVSSEDISSNTHGGNKKIPPARRSSQQPSRRLPSHRSGTYGILMAFLRLEHHSEFHIQGKCMSKKELIAVAQAHCNASYTIPENGTYYTAWSSMSQLIRKGLALRFSSPAKYKLTQAGWDIAHCLLASSTEAARELRDQSGKTSWCDGWHSMDQNQIANKSDVAVNFVNHSSVTSNTLSSELPGNTSLSSSVTTTCVNSEVPRTQNCDASEDLTRWNSSIVDKLNGKFYKNNQCIFKNNELTFQNNQKYTDESDDMSDFEMPSQSLCRNYRQVKRRQRSDASCASRHDRKKQSPCGSVRKKNTPTIQCSVFRSGTAILSDTFQCCDFDFDREKDECSRVGMGKGPKEELSMFASEVDGFLVDSVPADKFQVVLLIDHRENQVRGKEKDKEIQTSLLEQGIVCERRQLPIGDYMWILKETGHSSSFPREICLSFIVERKRYDDLVHSMMHRSRLSSQMHRFIATGISHRILLVEQSPVAFGLGMDGVRLKQAINGMQVEGDFFVKIASDARDVETYLVLCTRIIQQLVQGCQIEIWQPRSDDCKSLRGFLQWGQPRAKLIQSIEYQTFLAIQRRATNGAVREIFAQQLMHLSGLTASHARSITHVYPTPARFAHALRDAVASEQYLCETEPNSDEGDGSISCGLKQKKSQLSRSRRLLTPRDLFWNALESSNCRIGQALRVKLEQLYLWT